MSNGERLSSASGRQDGSGGPATTSNATQAGLTVTEQAPVTAVATVSLEKASPSAVWTELANSESFQETLVDAVLDAARDRPFLEVDEALQEAGVDALHGAYRSLVLRTARGDQRALWDLLRATRGLGTGRSPFEDVLAATRLFALALEHTPDRDVPTIEVRVTQAFREVRADQRRRLCELITTLARGCDVRLVATGLLTQWLAQEHREDLPGVSEACSTPPRSSAPLDELVSAAFTDLNLDGREVEILRTLADEPGETLTYHELYADAHVSDQRIRQCIGVLREDGLVESFGPDRDRRVELLEAGRAFVARVDREIGRQRRLDECVNETGNLRPKDRVNPAAHEPPLPAEAEGEDEAEGEGGGGGESEGEEGSFRVRAMGRPHRAAVAASARDRGVTLVDHPIEDHEDRKTHLVGYDDDREQAVVSVHGSGAFPHVVSTAVALASPRFIDRALPVSRLDTIDDPPAILRAVRCIGWLSSDALDDGQVLRDALVDAGLELQERTRQYHNGEYEDAEVFRGDMMQFAHGLAGAIVHLLETVDVDLVREIRVPGDLGRKRQLAPMAVSVAISAAIQARYGAFACYRQLFETRPEKRTVALTPEVDAADPFGELIGSYVIRGPDLHRFEPSLKAALESPATVHEDAPEIAIPVPVAHADHRAAYATAVRRMAESKNLEPTREAVSLCQAFTGSPYAVTRALAQLDRESAPSPRPLHPDEVRDALGALSAARILPDAPPTMSNAVHALLTARQPLTQTELADRAGISTRSVRNHTARLEAFALIEATADGYRLALPFRAERGAQENALPWFLTPNRERDDHRDTTEHSGLRKAVIERDPDGVDALERRFDRTTTPQIPARVRRAVGEGWPWAPPLLETVRILAADEPTRELADTVSFGAEIKQTALPARVPTAERTPA